MPICPHPESTTLAGLMGGAGLVPPQRKMERYTKQDGDLLASGAAGDTLSNSQRQATVCVEGSSSFFSGARGVLNASLVRSGMDQLPL